MKRPWKLRKISSILKNEDGTTLVGVLVAAGIGLMVLGSLLASLLAMHGSQKHLSQKYETLDLKQDLLTSFRDANLCTCNLTPVPGNLADPANFKFDASVWDDEGTPNDESRPLELPALRTACPLAAPPSIEANQKVAGTQTGLVVDKIKLKNLRPLDPSLAANLRTRWKGVWEISFLPDSTGTVVAPVRIRQHFDVANNAASPENARRVAACIASGDGVGGGGVGAPVRAYKGTTTVGFFNGQPHSEFSQVIPYPPNCNDPKVFLQGTIDSIACGNGIGPTLCSAYPGQNSQDVMPYLVNVNAAGFQVFYSGMSGVWVGAISPAYRIHWMVACD